MVTIISISADVETINKFRDLAHHERRTQKALFAEAVNLLEEKLKEEMGDEGNIKGVSSGSK